MIYLAVAAFCIIFNAIYERFGHGVTSIAMTWMFLTPLLGGALPFEMLMLIPGVVFTKGYRFFCNCYNAGISTLLVASLQTGVFEIAGTSSDYTILFAIAGWALIGIGLMALLCGLIRKGTRQELTQ